MTIKFRILPPLNVKHQSSHLPRLVLANKLLLLLSLLSGLALADVPQSIGWAQLPATQRMRAPSTNPLPDRSWPPDEIILSAPPNTAMAAQSLAEPMQIGLGRPVVPLKDIESFARRQTWHPTATGGHAFTFQITSPGAKALRLGLRIISIPDEAIVSFYDPAGKTVYVVTGAEISALLRLNFSAGEMSLDAETYWSPVIEGESQILDIEIPAGIDPAEVKISLPRLSHLFQLSSTDFEVEPLAALSCHQDVTCYASWSPISNATARMIFTQGASSYLCTGTLLNYVNNTTFIPYFLSANHCISTQAVASTLQTYWFYRSSTCNGSLGSYQTRFGGAELLYANENTDISFMRLQSAPPPGTVWAGWSATLPTVNQDLIGVHHPQGDLQKISFGDLESYGSCSWSGSTPYCWETSPSEANGFNVIWNNGLIEPGSSGSGIFNTSQQLVGTLSVGNINYGCGVTNFGGYGRFDIPYRSALYQWLSNPGSPSLNSAVLPYARAVKIGTTATAFASVINNGTAAATGCSLALPSGTPATFIYQTTNSSNLPIGTPNTPVDIPAGSTQSFVFGITPTASMNSNEIALVFDCANSNPAPSKAGLNTFILSATTDTPPDLLAIGATPSNDGVVRLPSNTVTNFFATAAVNLGSSGNIVVSADDGGRQLPLILQLCETNSSGQSIICGNNLNRSVNPNETVFYTVFVTGKGSSVPFNPGENRLFLRILANGNTVGATNVAVTAP